jgi:transcriptional regulator with XRE-family HTH domain
MCRVREVQKSAIGRILRAKREGLGVSQETLAERAEVDRSYVSILERGLKSPTLETLERICIALGTLPERVLEEARKVKR